MPAEQVREQRVITFLTAIEIAVLGRFARENGLSISRACHELVVSGVEWHIPCDLHTDPREASGQMVPMFPARGMFSIMKTRYLMWKEKYPDKVPFDPAAAIMRVPSERT